MTQPQTMGAYLRSARRRRRASIERAAEDTKIRADFLMRMESDEFDFLAPPYVRGFLKSYASYLRVDPDPLLREFDRRYAANRVDPTEHIVRGQKKMPKERDPRSRWIVAAGSAAVILVILAFVGLAQGDNEAPQVAEAPTSSPSPTPTPTPTPSPTPTEDETPSDGTLALADGFDVEVVGARDACWVEVTVDGEIVFSDTVAVGETHSFSAEEDMSIVFGFPPGVDLVVEGKNFGAPGGPDATVVDLPDDIDTL